MTFDAGQALVGMFALVGTVYSVRAHRQVRSPNGSKTGETIYRVKQDVEMVKADVENVKKKLAVYGPMLVGHETRIDKLERV